MSQTQTITKPPAQASRTHDYLYDPLYTLSSERDHARATFRANANVARIRRFPEFRDMFSCLNHHPNSTVRLDSIDPVPNFIPRQWRGYSEQAREALIRYTRFNYDPNVSVPPKVYEHADVSGKDRYKFFRRPIIPFLQQVPPDVVLHNGYTNFAGTDVIAERTPTPFARNAMVQTDYRDSETQTDPYSPEHISKPGSQSELLTLAALSYGHGLPAGLAEVEMIERARAKRAWEATLPGLHDMEHLDLRRKMMDEQERKEWAFREKEIEKLQEAKLKVLEKILQKREEKHSELNIERLERLWTKIQKAKEIKFNKIRAEHIKMIRKLNGKHKNIEGKFERRNILREYADNGSQAYAPMSRIGVFLDLGSERYKIRSKYLTTYEGLLELEASLPEYVLRPKIQAPKASSPSKDGYVTRQQRRQQELDEIAREIEDSKHRKNLHKPLKLLEKIEKPIPRPPTPTVSTPNEEDEKRELALICLQKIIRGRAIQNMMHDGKERRLQLINELRSTHALQQAEVTIKKQEKNLLQQKQRQDKLDQQDESSIDEILDRLEGESLGDMLDFLSKELIRFQEERRIHAFAMLAERERRKREAEESGRRQIEERRRREEDEIFKQVIGVHQETVDSYLTFIITDAIEMVADEQAKNEVEEMARTINQVAYEMENSRTQLQSEEIVAELVSAFLLPEVERISMRENVRKNQRKHLLAAHSIVYNETEAVLQQSVDDSKKRLSREPQEEDGKKEDN